MDDKGNNKNRITAITITTTSNFSLLFNQPSFWCLLTPDLSVKKFRPVML